MKQYKQKWQAWLHQERGRDHTEFLPAALEVVETPPSPLGRLLLWLLCLLLVVTLLWTCLGTVDEVAVAPGKLIPVGQVKTIQAEDKGVVKHIFVKEGEKVEAGQVLLELDTIFTAADVTRLKKEVAYLTLEIERLLAEQQERPFAAKLVEGLEHKDVEYQQQLYQSRLFEYQTRLSAAESSLRQSEAALQGAQASYVKLTSLYDIAKEKERRIDQLVTDNAIATFVLFDHRAKRLELEQDIGTQQAELSRLEWAIQQSRDTIATTKAERQRDIASKLVDDRKQLQGYQEELKKAAEKDRLSHLTAPIGGRVSQLAVHTVGGVVTAAQPVMDIVPEEAELQVEAWVANKDIGFIQLGQQAEVKVETFSFQKFGTIAAEVVEISPNAIDDKEKGRVYRVMLRLERSGFSLGSRLAPLTPGMNATGEIKIRQKRIIEFFLDTFRQYTNEALRER